MGEVVVLKDVQDGRKMYLETFFDYFRYWYYNVNGRKALEREYLIGML